MGYGLMRTTLRDICPAVLSTRIARAVATLFLASISVSALSHSRPETVETLDGQLRFSGTFKPTGDDQIDHAFVVPVGTAHLEIEIDCPSAREVGTIEYGLRGPGGFRGWTMDGRSRIYIDTISASA